ALQAPRRAPAVRDWGLCRAEAPRKTKTAWPTEAQITIMIAHIVLFRPKPGITAAQRRTFAKALSRTCREASSVRRASVGRTARAASGVARIAGSDAYPYAAVIEFDDADGLRAYLSHPAHEELARLFWEACDATIIVDFETTDLKGDGVEAF